MSTISTNTIHNVYITETAEPTATNLLPVVRKKINFSLGGGGGPSVFVYTFPNPINITYKLYINSYFCNRRMLVGPYECIHFNFLSL
jgi:hypothetical protein